MSALSAMKWTPQKMMNSASWCWPIRFDELPRVADVVGELDDLVALVVMAEDHEPPAERPARGGDAAIHLLDGEAEVAVRQRLPLADVLVLVLRQERTSSRRIAMRACRNIDSGVKRDAVHGDRAARRTSHSPAMPPSMPEARSAGDEVVEGVALVGLAAGAGDQAANRRVVMISGVSDPAM